LLTRSVCMSPTFCTADGPLRPLPDRGYRPKFNSRLIGGGRVSAAPTCARREHPARFRHSLCKVWPRLARQVENRRRSLPPRRHPAGEPLRRVRRSLLVGPVQLLRLLAGAAVGALADGALVEAVADVPLPRLLNRAEPASDSGECRPSSGCGCGVFTLVHVDGSFVGSPPGGRPTLPGGSITCNCSVPVRDKRYRSYGSSDLACSGRSA